MGEIIAVANQKGGVAKTTTVINLAAALGRKGYKVLMVDADSQGSLTIASGIKQADDLEVTLASKMYERAGDNEVDNDVMDAIMNIAEQIDLIPGNITTAPLETYLVNVIGRELLLRDILNEVRDEYDYILIDCMPSLGMMTLNALVAADNVLIPVQAEYLSVKGLNQLLGAVKSVKGRLNRNLGVKGIVITMLKTNTRYGKDIVSKIEELFGNNIHVFEAQIPNTIKVAEASIAGKSVIEYCPESKAAEAYLKLGEELIRDGKK